MNRDLSKHPKVVRRLDGALTAWRYFHGPNFVHEIRARRRRKARIYQYDSASVMREEGEALMLVLVRFVEWMQAPITSWAGAYCTNDPKIPWDPRSTGEILADIAAQVAKRRSDIARAMSKGRPGSPFYTDEL